MALPVFESSTLSLNAANATTLTVDMPATRPDGDLYLFVAGKDGGDDFTGIDASWTEIHSLDNAANHRLHAWFKIGSGEPASYALTTDSQESWGIVIRISATAGTLGINADGIVTFNGVDQSAPDITTTQDETLVIRIMNLDTDIVTATPVTEIVATSTSGGGAGSVSIGASRETGPNPAGATGTAQFTHVSDDGETSTIAVEASEAPAGGAGGFRIFSGRRRRGP